MVGVIVGVRVPWDKRVDLKLLSEEKRETRRSGRERVVRRCDLDLTRKNLRVNSESERTNLLRNNERPTLGLRNRATSSRKS